MVLGEQIWKSARRMILFAPDIRLMTLAVASQGRLKFKLPEINKITLTYRAAKKQGEFIMLETKQQQSGETEISNKSAAASGQRKPLRLWPGSTIVVLQWLAWLVWPMIADGAIAGYGAVFGGFIGGLGVIIWWAFFSRAPIIERVTAIPLMILTVICTSFILHKSIATGFMGMMYPIYVIPFVSLAFVIWAVFADRLAPIPRRASMVAVILLAAGMWAFLRTDGITGQGRTFFAWRWSATAEEKLLAANSQKPLSAVGGIFADSEAEWPGFRGPGRDGIVSGVKLITDWSASPPKELWRRKVGPGWSSFAVHGNLFYTQEQRGEEELVACYNLATGEPVWQHRDAVRFWEANSGAGPRGTPALSGGRVYTFGGTGIVNGLDAANGNLIWSRNAGEDADVKMPGWGFSSSPLVVDDMVVIAVRGKLAAYDLATGEPRWFSPSGRGGYSSPQHIVIDNVPQILLMTYIGAISVDPANGTQLWEHLWEGGTRIVQPALTADGDILMSGGEGTDFRRIAVSKSADGWTVTEKWQTNRLKPYFNDFVVHNGHAYGFDGSILACLNLENGKRKWKGGRYGHGQMVLLPEQDLLVVISEKGELALVSATPEKHQEFARFPAIKGKTWNHPALVGDVLLIRNAREMAAFRLPLADGAQPLSLQ